jgi:FimV-like protein|tara:strand:- start:3708 stop:4637 length:930 start_codon:yes stop_codon:yes gene_type:complete
MNYYKFYLFFIFLTFGSLVVSDENKIIKTDKYNNLWSIGLELKETYKDFSIYQIMISLLEINEIAFNDRNINFMNKGYILSLPSLENLEEIDLSGSVREVARQNFAANVGPVDYSVLDDVLVLSKPEILIKEENDKSLSQFEIIQISDNDESLVPFQIIDKEPNLNLEKKELEQENEELKIVEIPNFEIVSDEISTLESNLNKITEDEFMNNEFYLILGLIILIGLIFIFRNRPAKNIKKIEKKDEESQTDLDEEFGEIGDPIEARINLAITYIEMNQIDKANELLSQVVESDASEIQIEKAQKLLKSI